MNVDEGWLALCGVPHLSRARDGAKCRHESIKISFVGVQRWRNTNTLPLRDAAAANREDSKFIPQ